MSLLRFTDEKRPEKKFKKLDITGRGKQCAKAERYKKVYKFRHLFIPVLIFKNGLTLHQSNAGSLKSQLVLQG